jgi:hypothetical protein
MINYLPLWRRIIALWIKRLPSNEKAMDLDQFYNIKNRYDRLKTRSETRKSGEMKELSVAIRWGQMFLGI